MSRKLASTVYVDGTPYVAGSTVSDEVAAKISNEAAFAPESETPPSDSAPAAAAASLPSEVPGSGTRPRKGRA